MSVEERLSLPLSDLEASQLDRERHENAAARVLHRVGDVLDAADQQLEHWVDEPDTVASAIYRTSQDVASAVGNLAQHLEAQNEEQRRALAAACLRDVQDHSLYLQQEQQQQRRRREAAVVVDMDDSVHRQVANLQEHDFVQILQAAAVFLRDVQASFQALEMEEAEEVADVALTVARLFMASLQSVHAQIAPEDLVAQFQQQQSTTATRGCSVTIEQVGDEDDAEQDGSNRTNPSKKQRQPENKNKKQRNDRLRVLWPPLGPQVQKACQWGQTAAVEQPLLALALAFTLWPAAIVSAFCAPPLLITDKILQGAYNHFQEGPLLQNIERGAAQLYHTGRLALVSGKLVTRQGLRIARRQVERNGGLSRMAHQAFAFGVDRVTHPLETAGMVWDGLCWTRDRVCETVDHIRDYHDEERGPVVMRLQQ